MDDKPSLSYRDAGVDIDAGNSLVERIKPVVKSTARPEVLTGLGGFGGLFALPVGKYREPVLVSGTDGVGTKLKLAIDTGRHDTVGIDLVAMCVNDIVVTGAEPLFFLDYFATGHLDVEMGEAVVSGIAEGCRQAGAALIGGETAEMPGMYAAGDYDLAGFAVGCVERDAIISPERVSDGDVLLALASSGPHSNGYSLIRKILEVSGAPADAMLGERLLRDALLMPTRIYVKPLLALMAQIRVNALAHITGGGLVENVPRVLPEGVDAVIDLAAWSLPEVFAWLRDQGNVAETEMLRTFNCGIGMVICVAEADALRAASLLEAAGETVHCIGRIVAAPGAPEVRFENRLG